MVAAGQFPALGCFPLPHLLHLFQNQKEQAQEILNKQVRNIIPGFCLCHKCLSLFFQPVLVCLRPPGTHHTKAPSSNGLYVSGKTQQQFMAAFLP